MPVSLKSKAKEVTCDLMAPFKAKTAVWSIDAAIACVETLNEQANKVAREICAAELAVMMQRNLYCVSLQIPVHSQSDSGCRVVKNLFVLCIALNLIIAAFFSGTVIDSP